MAISKLSNLKLKLSWLYLPWFSLIFTFFVFMVLGTAVRGNPVPMILGWGIFSDIAVFSIGIWDLGMILAAAILFLILARNKLGTNVIGLTGRLSMNAVLYAVGGFIISLIIYNLTEIALDTVGISMFWRGGSNSSLITVRTAIDWSIMIIGPVIISPLTEEIIFRGYVLTFLLERIGKKLAVIISAVIFMSVHIMFGLGLMVYIFFVAIVSGIIYIRFKSLYPCMLMHFLINLWAYVVVPLFFMQAG